ncbi:hypothetical protein BKA70DRAFT_1417222 [Coprinopsis sp. MPI-PUGE-AT-0042]|nr:hypothetical protein BKA70DRAFT_1417222 [Coprinopsis sp. MPI-PUGE-AT-0042]
MSTDAFLNLASQESTYTTCFIAMPVAGLAVLLFEFLQNLQDEAKYIWPSPWHSVKCSSILTGWRRCACSSLHWILSSVYATWYPKCSSTFEFGPSRTEPQAGGLLDREPRLFGVSVIMLILYIRGGEWGP